MADRAIRRPNSDRALECKPRPPTRPWPTLLSLNREQSRARSEPGSYDFSVVEARPGHRIHAAPS